MGPGQKDQKSNTGLHFLLGLHFISVKYVPLFMYINITMIVYFVQDEAVSSWSLWFQFCYLQNGKSTVARVRFRFSLVPSQCCGVATRPIHFIFEA